MCGKANPAFSVEVSGDGGDMIFISGLACGNNTWDKVKEHFLANYRLHIITLAGFGGNPAIKAPYMQTVKNEIIQYIKDNKMERPVIVGHSLGGMIAFWIAAEAPNAVGVLIAVDGLPSFAALHSKHPDSWLSKFMMWLVSRKIKKQSREEFIEGHKHNLKTKITAPEDIRSFVELSDLSDIEEIGLAFYEMMTFDIREETKNIKAPVLLLGATADIQNPEKRQKRELQYREQVKSIQKNKVAFAPKALHFIQLDEPQWLINQIDEFLR